MDIAQRVATAVSEAIAAKELTQVSISEATGIPRTTLIRRLRGQSPFTIAELQAIAAVLDEDPATFLRPAEDVA